MKLNLKLYRSLLQSDFFLMKNNINNKLSSVSILDIPSLLVNIKQLIRILHMINNTPSFKLVIFIDDKHNYFILKSLLKNYNKIIISTTFTTSALKDSICLMLSPSVLSINLYKRLFNNNFYIINNINSNLELNNTGAYKIFNDLNDIKKLVFLVSLIKSIFNKI